MRDQAQGSVAVTQEAATGKVGFVRAKGGDLIPSEVRRRRRRRAEAKADAYLDKYAAALRRATGELTRPRVDGAAAGWTVTYTQSYKGVAGLRVRCSRPTSTTQGDLTSVTGYAAPDLSLSTTPRDHRRRAGKARGRPVVKEPADLGRRRGRPTPPASRRRAPTSSSTAWARSRARPATAVLA